MNERSDKPQAAGPESPAPAVPGEGLKDGRQPTARDEDRMKNKEAAPFSTKGGGEAEGLAEAAREGEGAAESRPAQPGFSPEPEEASPKDGPQPDGARGTVPDGEAPRFPEPEDDGCIAAFPADLSREEYIDFNIVVSQNSGLLRFRKGQIILFSVLAVISVAMMVIDIVLAGSLDPVLVLLVIFLIAAAGILFIGIPRYVRSSAEKAYDQSLLNGYSYYGEVRVYPDRVEKRGKNTVVIPFAQNAVFLENRRMMALLAPGMPAIVLPARCMTPEAAEGMRRAVLPGIPPARQKLLERMVPLADAPLAPPHEAAAQAEDTELLAVDVEYTKEEFVRIVTDTALRAFLKLLPVYSGMSLLAGLMFGLMNGPVVGIASFLLLIGLLFALNVLTARARAVRSYALMPDSAKRVRVSFTDKGITVKSERPGESMRFVWKAVERAVERQDSVEFYTATSFLRIPKRCIPQMEELRTLVDSHRRS